MLRPGESAPEALPTQARFWWLVGLVVAALFAFSFFTSDVSDPNRGTYLRYAVLFAVAPALWFGARRYVVTDQRVVRSWFRWSRALELRDVRSVEASMFGVRIIGPTGTLHVPVKDKATALAVLRERVRAALVPVVKSEVV